MKKVHIFCKVLLSLIFSAIITLDSILVFPGTIDTNIKTIYFKNIEITNILMFFRSVNWNIFDNNIIRIYIR